MTPGPGVLIVRLDALLGACLLCLALGLGAQLGWRGICITVLELPSTLAPFENPTFVLSAVVPVLGNGLGFVLTHRNRTRRAVLPFVGPSTLLTCVGLAVGLAQLPASSGLRAVAATAVLVLITPALTVTVLLARTDLLQRRPAPLTPLAD